MTIPSPSTVPSSPAAPAKRRFSWGQALVWAGLLGLLAIIALGLQRAQSGPVAIGEPVPDFTLSTFDGQQFRLADLRGKVVVLNFWASWCLPCEEEAADLQSAWEQYAGRGDVIFLGVAWTDTEPASLGYLKKFGITYPNGPDLGTRISQAYRTTGVPETYIIDRDGKLAAVKLSPFLSINEIRSMIEPLLGQ